MKKLFLSFAIFLLINIYNVTYAASSNVYFDTTELRYTLLKIGKSPSSIYGVECTFRIDGISSLTHKVTNSEIRTGSFPNPTACYNLVDSTRGW